MNDERKRLPAARKDCGTLMPNVECESLLMKKL